MKRYLSLLLCLIITALSLVSCLKIDLGDLTATTTTTEPGPSPNIGVDPVELAQTVYENSLTMVDEDYKNVYQWLNKWGLRGFDSAKLNKIKRYYDVYFVREVPPSLTIAQGMAQLLQESQVLTRVDITDNTELTDILITCMLAAMGDKYANYFNKQDYLDYQTDYTGKYVGIGVSISYNSISNTMTVTAVFNGSPAEEAGLLPGDVIVAVGGVSVSTMTYQEAVAMVRGEAGTTVEISVDRGGTTVTLDVVRRQVDEVTVLWSMVQKDGHSLGLIRITSFGTLTAEQFKQAVDAVQSQGAEGIIFDLRSNPGGQLTAILEVLDYLLPDGQPLASYDYYSGQTQQDVGKDGHRVDLPFTVLCNEYTASAGELFTSAMKDYDDRGLISAHIVGVTTYGKGSMQGLFPLGDGTAMTVTIAYYNPPFSPNYEGVGILPDVVIDLPEELKNKSVFLLTEDEDVQLAAAYENLISRLDLNN